MKLTEQVYVVGGGDLGYRISSPFDCNVFLLDGGGEYVMIDAGSGINPGTIEANLIADGIPPEKIRALILTHAHADHAGGAAYWKERCGAAILAGALTSDILASGDEERISLPDARKAGVYPPEYRFEACTIDRVLKEGDLIPVGSLSLQIMAAPGHSADMMAFYCPELQALFGGDAVFEGGKLAVLTTYDFSLEEYRRTIADMAKLSVGQLFPGHGPAVLQEAQESVQLAQRRFERGEPPISIV
ncbi:MBL fold metallo-hydrolase [Paenibacillus aurantius]|uniref:beta-lactamase n=1 Tax=Paenibacillus aurantius TaxID=2918900 RepID=A0AA96LHB6_9BACL|nr:MBL fold metallo-hydrolase [Paenibacillus aurantius]WNQ13264.1 MBL fold metallo-hydrolase [Paenibacillus aurantius]